MIILGPLYENYWFEQPERILPNAAEFCFDLWVLDPITWTKVMPLYNVGQALLVHLAVVLKSLGQQCMVTILPGEGVQNSTIGAD